MSWSLVRLGDICNFVRGPFGGALKKESFVEDGFAVYEQQHAIYNQFSDIRYYIDSDKFEDLKRFELHAGDIIMSCSGTMGKVAVVPDGIKQGIINQALLKLTPNCNLDIAYFMHWLKSESFQFQLGLSSHGAAIKNVASVKVLKELEIPLPPLEEQKRIAAILDKADAIRQKRKQAIDFADELLRSVFLDMFGNPVTNPKGWELKKWHEVITIVNGKNQKGVLSDTGEYPIMGSGGEMGRATDYLTPANSVIIGRKGNINKPILVKENFWNVDTAFGLKPNREQISHNYLYWFCVFFDFERLNKAVTIPSLTKVDLLDISIPLPNIELQEKFDTFVEKIEEKKLRYRDFSGAPYFQALSQKAFSGQL